MFLGLSLHHGEAAGRARRRRRPSSPRSAARSSAREPLGYALFLALQVATTLILILAANTSFADFPRLANFHAADNFMPRQLTVRGHRLVFSNGIIGARRGIHGPGRSLFKADVSQLIPFYAIGVFTSFTLSQAGMSKRHLRLREPGGGSASRSTVVGAITTARRHDRDRSDEVHPRRVGGHGLRPRHGPAVGPDEPSVRARGRGAGGRPAPARRERRSNGRSWSCSSRRSTHKMVHALGYAKTIRAEQILAVHIEADPMTTLELETAWESAGLTRHPV